MSGGMTETQPITVELFGVPRLLTGKRAVDIAGLTLRDVSAALASACPCLAGPVIDSSTGWLADGYTFVVNERFTRDPGLIIPPESPVLLVSSLAGG